MESVYYPIRKVSILSTNQKLSEGSMQGIGAAACSCKYCRLEPFLDRSNSRHRFPDVHPSNGCRKNNKRMNRTLENIQLTGLEAIMISGS